LSAGREIYGAKTNLLFPGYWCAYVTLFLPWSRDGLNSLHEWPLLYFAILLSGWITPMFLLTLGFLLKKSTHNTGQTLRIVLLLMLPACWIVFSQEHLRPRYGYYLWTAAMLLALFASSLSNQPGDSETQRKIA
jgi:4-amino-4-deoxy-L-arabinose transferase-like glycosyltransferase